MAVPGDATEPRPATPRPPLPVRLARYARREAKPAVDAIRAGSRRIRSSPPRHAPWEHGRSLEHQWQWSACYAPLTSLYLDQFGTARACCQNTEHPLGDIRVDTLRAIWDGAATAQLRESLARGDLAMGCTFCAWQQTESAPEAQFLRTYDEGPAGWSRSPRWPRQLEFAVSNTCNLQCVMCNGDWSSSIRSQREHRASLPGAYPERFYEELVDFIPHLANARFTGGEPFLGTEPQRIMDLLVDHGAPDLVMSVVTNATIFNDRVERTLGSLTPWISVSLDGGTEQVYEQIRVGASFHQVLANIDRFAAIVADHGVGMNLTHCLMVHNWSTFPELLALAEERDLDVSVNTVRFPEASSLYHLPLHELDEIATTLERRTPEVERRLTGPRLAVWHQQLEALRNRAESGTWPAALGQPPVAERAATPVSIGPTRRPDEVR